MFKITFRCLVLILLLCVSCTKEKERGEFIRHYELVVNVRTTVNSDMFKYPCSSVFWTFIQDQKEQFENRKIVYELTTDLDPHDRQSAYAKELEKFVIDKYTNHLNPGLSQVRMLVESSVADAKAEALRLNSMKNDVEPDFNPYAEYSIQIICKDLSGELSDYEIYRESGNNHSWIAENINNLNN